MNVTLDTESLISLAAADTREVMSAIGGASDGSDRSNMSLIYAKASLLHLDAFFTLLGGGANRLRPTAGVHLRVAVELHLRALWASFHLPDDALWKHLEEDTGAGGFERLLRALESAAQNSSLGDAEKNTLETTLALVLPLSGESWGVLCGHAHGGTPVFLATYNSFKQLPPFEVENLVAMGLLAVRLAAHSGVFVSQVLGDQVGYDKASDVLVAWAKFGESFCLDDLRLRRAGLQVSAPSSSPVHPD